MQSLEIQRSNHNLTDPLSVAQDILNIFITNRRMERSTQSCEGEFCVECARPHLQKVSRAVLCGEPVVFALPAFPGKSPNQAKVLGHLPDMAEKQALIFLNELCQRVKTIYQPGARIVICSDGRVFSDVVGMSEENVTAYQNKLREWIHDLGLTNLSTFNLDDLHENMGFDQLRAILMAQYGQALETLREKVKRGSEVSASRDEQEAHRIYCGITRFLFEDSLFPGQKQSRTSMQKSARARAYEVVRRSNAWSDLIANVFADAVRLSIHPQSCGSKKLGIQLLGKSAWLTPWHGVAVETEFGFTLMKRNEAEKLGARLMLDLQGRPSHFQLLTQD